MIEALHSWLRKRWFWILILVAAGLGAARFGWKKARGPLVDTVEVRAEEMVHRLALLGRARAREIELAPLISGQVASAPVEEGARVSLGDVLFTLEGGELAANLEQAKASLRKAEAGQRELRKGTRQRSEESRRQAEVRFTEATGDLQRLEALLASGVASEEQVERARNALALAESALRRARTDEQSVGRQGAETLSVQADVEQARASVALAEARLSYATVRAPRAGIILSRNVERGDMVQPGTVVFTMAVAEEAEILVDADERHLSLLKEGQSAQASTEAYPDESFAARVSAIAPRVDPRRGTILVRLAIPEPPGYLQQDMTVSVTIEVGRKPAALVVPLGSVEDLAADAWVQKIEEGRAARHPVEVGIIGTERVEILKGLSKGDAIVATPDPTLEGRKVRAKP